MEELYLSSDALRSLSKLTRHLILHDGIVLKMSDPLVLTKVFETCERSSNEQTLEMFSDLKDDMSKPSLDDSTSFVFYVDDHVLSVVQASTQNLVMRDKYGNEKLRNFR